MSRSVAELPKVAGTCPGPLTAAIRRAVRSGGSWQQTADRGRRGCFDGRARRCPACCPPEQLAGDPSGYQTHLVHAEPDGSFSIVVMVWLPGPADPDPRPPDLVRAPAVLQGTEYEEVYALRGDHLEVVARNAQPGRHGQRLRPARRHPPGHQHRRLAWRSRCTSTAPTSPASAPASAASTTSRSCCMCRASSA